MYVSPPVCRVVAFREDVPPNVDTLPVVVDWVGEVKELDSVLERPSIIEKWVKPFFRVRSALRRSDISSARSALVYPLPLNETLNTFVSN